MVTISTCILCLIILYTFYLQVSDIKDIHAIICPSYHDFQMTHVQYSLDGVQESKSSAISIDAHTINIKNCRNIYPLRCIKPFNRIKYDEQSNIKCVLNDLNNNHCIMDFAVCDNPKRSILRNALSHSSLYACEYCESSAKPYVCQETSTQVNEHIQELAVQISDLEEQLNTNDNDEQAIIIEQLINELRTKQTTERKKIKHQHIVWPSDTMFGSLRTINSIMRISTAIATQRNSDEESEELSREERVGIVGTSILLHQPNFNMLNCLPVEYMHSVCIGVVKRLLELTFKVGVSRPTLSTRKLTSPKFYNDLICQVRVPREFSRRGRHLDLSVMKAQEMRNIVLFFFPLIVQCIDDNYAPEQSLWLLLGYMIRACIIPNNEFENVSKDEIKHCCNLFYKTYETVHGQKQCSYSIHVVCSHLLQIRGKHPLTTTSAFKFESYYSEMKQCFQPGTTTTCLLYTSPSPRDRQKSRMPSSA